MWFSLRFHSTQRLGLFKYHLVIGKTCRFEKKKIIFSTNICIHFSFIVEFKLWNEMFTLSMQNDILHPGRFWIFHYLFRFQHRTQHVVLFKLYPSYLVQLSKKWPTKCWQVHYIKLPPHPPPLSPSHPFHKQVSRLGLAQHRYSVAGVDWEVFLYFRIPWPFFWAHIQRVNDEQCPHISTNSNLISSRVWNMHG